MTMAEERVCWLMVARFLTCPATASAFRGTCHMFRAISSQVFDTTLEHFLKIRQALREQPRAFDPRSNDLVASEHATVIKQQCIDVRINDSCRHRRRRSPFSLVQQAVFLRDFCTETRGDCYSRFTDMSLHGMWWATTSTDDLRRVLLDALSPELLRLHFESLQRSPDERIRSLPFYWAIFRADHTLLAWLFARPGGYGRVTNDRFVMLFSWTLRSLENSLDAVGCFRALLSVDKLSPSELYQVFEYAHQSPHFALCLRAFSTSKRVHLRLGGDLGCLLTRAIWQEVQVGEDPEIVSVLRECRVDWRSALSDSERSGLVVGRLSTCSPGRKEPSQSPCESLVPAAAAVAAAATKRSRVLPSEQTTAKVTQKRAKTSKHS